MIDWMGLDKQLLHAVHTWRAACARLDADRGATPEHCDKLDDHVALNPIDPDLVGETRRGALSDLDDPMAAAFSPWLEALAAERACWNDRVAIAREWQLPQHLPQYDATVSRRELRRALLTHPQPNGRRKAALALQSCVGAVSDRSIAALELRLERDAELAPHCQHSAVAGMPADTAPRLARELLDGTSDAADELSADSWYEGLATTLAMAADRGWPARLNARWLFEIFAGGALTEGLALRMPPLPPARGAMSFARALGQLGEAVLEAGRSPTLPLALHQHPMGTRRHQRRSLFASLAAEPSFARKVLGLGNERARTHCRVVARAMLGNLRIDALRVLACEALREGKGHAQERFEELASTVLGPAAPRALLATIPRLRAADGANLVGSLLAVEQRQQLVEDFDEDWFRSPAAINLLRHQDCCARETEATPAERALERLRRCLELLRRQLEQTLC